MLLLSATDVSRVLDVADLTAAVDASFRETSAGMAQVPPRIKLTLANSNDRLIVMPAYLSRSRALATKIVTTFPRNTERGIPLINGLVVLNDSETGVVLAIIDGGSVTGLRTAAASGVAARALASAAPKVLALIGAGVQGRAHLRILAALYPLREVRVCATRLESAERLAREASGWVSGLVRAVAGPEEATRGADLVVTATTTVHPVLRGDWLKHGAHVCAVGAATLTHREIDTEVLTRAAVIAVDTRDGALTEAGDIVIPLAEGRISPDQIVEVGAILLGRSRGRQQPDEITVYKGVGTAAMDAAVAATIYQGAVKRGVGTEIILADQRR